MSDQGQGLMTMPLLQAIEAYGPNFAAALPPEITLAHFKRMLIVAVSTNPDLYHADRRTLFNSAIKCASDGLLPDGREAALVVYRTKFKERGQERYIDAVQYMPMIAGIRKRMRNSGNVVSAVAEVVYRNDRFHYRLGDDAAIEHEPPALDQDRGDAVGAYAIIRLVEGDPVREVMPLREIQRVRSFSKAKDGPAWTGWWSEMARKTVLRRAAKAVPQSSTMARLLARDDEPPELPPAETMALVPPRPERSDFDADTDEPKPDLPLHLTERELPEEHDEETGEIAEAEQPTEKRAEFWSGDKFYVAPVAGAKGNRPDWQRTQMELLYWIGEARSADELGRLQADSKRTLDGLKLAYIGLHEQVMAAIERRTAELGAKPTAEKARCDV